MQRSTGVLCAAFAFLAILRPAAGDVFLLHSGGRVEGALVNADEDPRTSYVISLPGGGQLTLDAATVDKVQPVRPELVEYEKVRRQSPDTVAGQLKMANWCREHGLAEQRTMHLKRVLQLDPDQADVRRALGYHKVKDQWMTRDEEKADQGLVKRDGIWITPQRAEILDSQKKQLKAEADWRRKISTWRNWLDGKQAEQAKRSLRAIDDPMAITALTERLTKKREARTDARLLYVEALAHINTQMARGTLAASAIDDPLEEVRLSCLDELQRQKDDGVTDYFIGRMRDKRASNETINRAGVALGRMKNPSCVETLIDYLDHRAQASDSTSRRAGRDDNDVQQEGRPRRRPGHESTANCHHQLSEKSGRARRLGGHHRPELRLRPAGMEHLVRGPEGQGRAGGEAELENSPLRPAVPGRMGEGQGVRAFFCLSSGSNCPHPNPLPAGEGT